MGSLWPGLMLAGMYAIYVLAYGRMYPNSAPAIPMKDASFSKLMRKVFLVLLPPLSLILLVLGSIFAGVATPTEAGALGAVGAMVLAILNKRFSKESLFGALDQTVKTSVMVMFLLIGSTAHKYVRRYRSLSRGISL